MIYLDNSATTRQYDEVTDEMVRVAKNYFGNPSSLHRLGFDAGNILFNTRREFEECFGPDGTIIFTSGGTESDNWAIMNAAYKHRRSGKKIITTKIEHSAILKNCKRLEDEGFNVEYLDVDVDGYLEPQVLKAALDEDTILVSIMTVNNEVGTIEPVKECQRIVREYNKAHNRNIVFHTDAIQAFGKLRFDDSDFDLISVSAHKIHGPRGVGLLYMKNDVKLPPYICGGGQEMGYRSGTENTPGIAGFGVASHIAHKNLEERMKTVGEVNNYLRKGLQSEIKDVILNGPEELGYTLHDGGKRCPSVLNLSFLGTRGEVLLHTLEQDGIYVSTGSACSSHNKNSGSHVLKAMSMDDKEIEGAIRFSFSEYNTFEEMDVVIEKVKTAVNRFRKLGSFR